MGWLIRKQEASLTNFGCYPGARPLEEYIKNGIIILDKPSGPTSNQVDNWIKQILNIKKCSHAGTLDPRASGVLLIAIENATKLMPILLSSKKEYVGVISLHEEVDHKKIREVFSNFIGKVKQLPPLKSAVARRVREREIYYLEILEIDGKSILFKVGCEAGFYVRRLAVDVGKKLGVKSHLQELRRTKSGDFTEDSVITLQDLIDAAEEKRLKEVIHPMELAVESIGKVVVSDNSINNISNGSPLYIGGVVRLDDKIKKGSWAALFTLKGELIAIGKASMDSEDMHKKKRGMVVKVDRVLIKKGKYPKF